MSSRPILPSKLAFDMLSELKDFVSALFFVRDVDTRKAIIQCLFDKDPMVKGPFFSLKAPFLPDPKGQWNLDPSLKSEHTPYLHQVKSFEQLKFPNPKNTLITTGTGSGKTECFLYPILDYVLKCKRSEKIKGVKALILYPMNALIEDQGERFSRIANKLNTELNFSKDQWIRIGRYTGDVGRCSEHIPEIPTQIINERKALCENPPDILLTNFKMLDFMLFRPEEQNFWNKQTQMVFKYLVLDELHTFDGAKGADVACLIRRLRLKLKKAQFACVGTSATIEGNDKKDLCQFAEKLFGENFEQQSVIFEKRVDLKDYVKSEGSFSEKNLKTIELPDLLVEGEVGYQKYVSALCKKWGAPKECQALGKWILKHPLTEKILKLQDDVFSLEDLAHHLDISKKTVSEFFDLIAYGRGKNDSALFQLQMQLWTQETKWLLRKLSKEIKFKRPKKTTLEKINPSKKEEGVWLPAFNCRECGTSGWLTVIKNNNSIDEQEIEQDHKTIFHAFSNNQAHLLFPVKEESDNNEDIYYFNEKLCKIYKQNNTKDDHLFPLKIRIQKNANRDFSPLKKKGGLSIDTLKRCPECESILSLSIASFGSSMLGSVISNAFLAHGANPEDKKLLIFNDSVQDAAHQAGYISSRTFRFNLRRYLLQLAQKIERREKKSSIKIKDLEKELKNNLKDKFDIVLNHPDHPDNSKIKKELLQSIPQDLWERWKLLKQNPFLKEHDFPRGELFERLSFEFFYELSLRSALGWSLRKTGQLSYELSHEAFEEWKRCLNLTCEEKSDFKHLSDQEGFLYGFILRMMYQGHIWRSEYEDCLDQKGISIWKLINKKPHLAAIFGKKTKRPKLITTRSRSSNKNRDWGLEYLISSNRNSWTKKWANRHGIKKSDEFYVRFFKKLASSPKSGLKTVGDKKDETFVLNSEFLEIRSNDSILFRCDTCASLATVSKQLKIDKLKCLQFRCDGSMSRESKESVQFVNYMKRQYQRSIVPIFAHVHTGQLKGKDRKQVEKAFKNDLLPLDKIPTGKKGSIKYYLDQPVNVITCTPTMEMGIDIGDLSGVVLRSFPRMLSSVFQRIGRSGRTSGNSLDIIIAKSNTPHDLYYWERPKEILKGKITTPGCEYRSPLMLIRQFYAYCLDAYAERIGEIEVPKPSGEENKRLINTPFWNGFIDFYQKKKQFLLGVFLGEILRIHDLNNQMNASLQPDIESEMERNNFIDALVHVLNTLDKNAQLFKKECLENNKELDTDKEAQQIRSRRVYENIDKIEYVFRALADQGILPNYAFPEKGVQLSATVRVRTSQNLDTQRPYQFISTDITRPGIYALRELCPEQYFYLSKFKIPITRLEKGLQKTFSKFICCQQCGLIDEVKKTEKEDRHGVEYSLKSCSNCGATDQSLISLLLFQQAYGDSQFGEAQIRDQDESRVQKHLDVTLWISPPSGKTQNSMRSCWVSKKNKIGLEFQLNAKISFVNQGYWDRETEEHRLFHVCKECLAVPEEKTEKNETKYIFKVRGINRHAWNCPHFRNPDIDKTKQVKIGLYRYLVSDLILVTSDSDEDIPTLKSIFMLGMRKFLKGNPGHIKVADFSFGEEQTKQHLVIIFDEITGGSGHLRSLMSLDNGSLSKSSKGIDRLNLVLKEVLNQLKNCKCQQGCYHCLLCFENQFEHDKISKEIAIKWLSRFLEVDDWEPIEGGLNVTIKKNSAFDGYSEKLLVSGIKKNEGELIHKVIGLEEEIRQGVKIYRIKIENGDYLEFEPTPFKKVSLKVSGYTKPDFHLWSKGKLKGYLYVDGANPHLNPDKEKPVFIQDVDLRTSLYKERGLPVLTITYPMIKKWIDSSQNQRSKTIQHQGKEQSVFLCHILSKLYKASVKTSVEQVFSSFVSEIFGWIGGWNEPYLSNQEKNYLIEALDTLDQRGDLKAFNGLSWNSKSKVFEFKTDKSTRTIGGDSIQENYMEAWSLFWILWLLDPNWVGVVFDEN